MEYLILLCAAIVWDLGKYIIKSIVIATVIIIVGAAGAGSFILGWTFGQALFH